MTYYTIINEKGQYFNGGMKLCSPPILMFSDSVDEAEVYRDIRRAENMVKRFNLGELWSVQALNSGDHPRLAD